MAGKRSIPHRDFDHFHCGRRYKAVESSEYDTRAPEKQSIAFIRLSPLGARVGTEAVEIQLSNLRGVALTEGEGLVEGNTFCTSELYRQVW